MHTFVLALVIAWTVVMVLMTAAFLDHWISEHLRDRRYRRAVRQEWFR